MKSHAAFRIIVLLFALSTSLLSLDAQKKTRLGINLTSNYDENTYYTPEAGLVFERQFSKHSGIEAGLNYRTYQVQLYLIYNNESYYPFISEHYISMPLTYKLYTRIINLSLGLTYDYYIGFRQLDEDLTVTSYHMGYDYYMGAIGKISKEIMLGDDLILEPEIKVNLLFDEISYKNYIGFGLNLKFDLSKE
jgi:hypothetical protein